MDTAPENFKMNSDDSYAFVYKQPENDEEKAVCEEALENCPVEAIGNDGWTKLLILIVAHIPHLGTIV